MPPWSGGGPSSTLGRTSGIVADGRAAGPMVRRLACTQEIGVRLPGLSTLTNYDSGCWSNGTTPVSHAGDRGSTPRRSTVLSRPRPVAVASQRAGAGDFGLIV